MPALSGFSVRKPRPHELPAIHAWFKNSPLHPPACLTLAAIGHPTPTPLGAIIVRSSPDRARAWFQLYLIPEARIPGANVDRTLFTHLLHLARTNHARRLILADLLPADHPDIAFWSSLGLSIETTLHTHALPIHRFLSEIADPRLTRPLPKIRLLPLSAINPAHAATFLAAHYSGFTDHLTPQFASDHFHPSISHVALHNETIVGLSLVRTTPAGTLDLLLTAPHTRPGPLPLFLLAHTARAALAARILTALFQSDPARDPFPTTIATRLHLLPTTTHHRLSLNLPNPPPQTPQHHPRPSHV